MARGLDVQGILLLVGWFFAVIGLFLGGLALVAHTPVYLVGFFFILAFLGLIELFVGALD